LESHPKAITLFVLNDGAIAGVLNAFVNFSTFKCKPMINVHDVFVSDVYRGKGLGRKLIQGIIEIGKSLSCGKITLEVRVDNPTAQNLYKSEGFEEGNDPMYFWTRPL
jgi:GNAT superfamily N-acetyltransferase